MTMDSISPIKDFLESLRKEISIEMLREMAREESMWQGFGRMNSHVYRKDLTTRFAKMNMTIQDIFRVYFLFSMFRRQSRVLKVLSKSEVKDRAWVPKVRSFIDSQVTSYTSQASSNKKFPGFNIPSTNPGLDIRCWIM